MNLPEIEVTNGVVKTIKESAIQESGQALLEFALSLLALLLLIFAILDLGWAVYINTTMSSAAQAGARAGTIAEVSMTTIEAAVTENLYGIDPDQIVIDRTDEFTEVELIYHYSPITPLLDTAIGGEGIQLRQAARMRRLGSTVLNP